MLLDGIVDQDVDLAERAERLCDDPLRSILFSDIASDGDRLAAFGLDDALRLGCIVIFAQIGDRDVGAFPGIESRHRPADPAVSTGYDRDLAREAIGSLVARLPLWLGIKTALVTRKRIFVNHPLRIAHGHLLLTRELARRGSVLRTGDGPRH